MRFSLIIFFSILPLLLWNCKKEKNSRHGSICDIKKPLGTYDYPIKPGTSQWVFTSQQEKLDACQIPQSTLAIMSTEAVMQSCLDLPVLGDLLLNVGVNITGITQFYMTNFSGLIELSKRIDAGSVMLERYKIMNPACANSNQAGSTSDFSAFEMIIGHDSIIKKLSPIEKKLLVKIAISKYGQKRTMLNYYALYGISTPLYICVKVMRYENYKPFIQLYNQSPEMQLFLSKLLWSSDSNKLNNMFEQINDQAILFSN